MDERVYSVKVRLAVHLRCFLSLGIDSKRSGILPSIAIVGRRQTHLRADHCRLFHIARTPVLFDAVEKNKNDVRSCSGTWVEDCGSVYCVVHVYGNVSDTLWKIVPNSKRPTPPFYATHV
jgi:hypothetical protein